MISETFTLPSFAKINWMLDVLGKRQDGFHEISTIYQTVDLCDRLTFKPSEVFSLSCSDPTIPLGEENIVYRAAEALAKSHGLKATGSIHIEKNIPSPGGLGGGSSNAAICLLGCSLLWGIEPAEDELVAIGASLGSDVPFFFAGGTALGGGRGEVITPISDVEEPFMIIVSPRFGVETASAFRALNADFLTENTENPNLLVSRLEGGRLNVGSASLTNHFEDSVFKRFPEIELIQSKLIECGARTARMSGSGSSVFAVFDKEETRQATLEAIRDKDWRMFAVATLSRSSYREALKPCHRLFPISF